MKAPRRNPKLVLSMHMHSLIGHNSCEWYVSRPTSVAIRNPEDRNQRKMEANRARRAQIRRGAK